MTAAERTASYRKRHPERIRERRKGYYKKEAAATRLRKSNPETWGSTALPNIRHRAKKAGIDCTITAADLKVPATCPVLGVPFTFSTETGRAARYNPSADRHDNNRGYVPGNVKIISLRANMLKSDATLEEMECVVAYMRGETN